MYTKIDIAKNELKQDWLLKINRTRTNVKIRRHKRSHFHIADGRIPAIVDNTVDPPQRIFEGAAIQLYLTDRYDQNHSISFPYTTPEYWEMLSWLTWMRSGIGPMQGQANHLYRYAPTRIEYAIDRYQTETKR
jgi:glutathione S-transferase